MLKERLKPYFEELVKSYVFNELSGEFLEKIGAADILMGIPMPIKESLLAESMNAGGAGGDPAAVSGVSLTVLDIARAAAVVVGCDPNFPYANDYKQFLQRIFKEKTEEVLVNEGYEKFSGADSTGNAKIADGSGNAEDADGTEKRLLEAACFFRAVLCINPESQNGLYGYALCCREIYLNADRMDDEEYIGKFKAESIEILETLTNLHPDFAFTYYYLGYAYLNMGLYTKAYLTWNDFLEKIKGDPAEDEVSDEINEIKDRLSSLAAPMEIEAGVTAVTSGRYHEGIEILSQYTEGELSAWWPMHYYIGVAYESTGDAENAVAAFKKALTLSPSNIDVMDELVAIYHALGDTENETKYAKKIEVVKNNRAYEKQQ